MGRPRKPVKVIELEKPCTACGSIFSLEEFYASWSLINKHTQKMALCKKCVVKLFNDLMNQTAKNTRLSLYYLCRLLDIVYDEKLYHSTFMNNEGESVKILGQYLKQANSLPQYKGRIFSDGDMVEEAANTNQIVARMETPEDEETSFKVTPEMRLKWGKDGRNSDDYYFLEKQYNKLVGCIDTKDPRQTMLLEEICNIRLEAEIARKGKRINEYEKLVGMVSKLMTDAGIKPKDDKSGADELVYGEWIRKLEEDEPVPEPSPEFKDVDGVRKYITLWFTRQFARIFSLGKDVIDDGGDDDNE